MSGFTHLHCHTEYSLLDGAIRLKDLCARSVDFGFSAAAITDHGNLFGTLMFYQEARKFGIKPIIGCEVYVAPGRRTEKHTDPRIRSGYHLVLLAQNLEGYHNLVRLVSSGYLEGFHYKPRVDKELLRKWNSGLVALSACLKGEVPYKLENEGFDAGLAEAREYADIFKDRFYLEMQANGLKEQDKLNQDLLELAAKAKLPLVATNDCHYLGPDDVAAHDVLLCIQTGKTVDDPKRMRFGTDKLYFRPPEEMEAAFSHCPEAIENVGRIADSCNVEFNLGQNHFPVYDIPEGMTMDQEFRRMVKEGVRERLGALPYEVNEQDYWDRAELELDVICQKGFPAYFLIVQDFINWAKREDIPVGPGRGSAAGSLVAYALKITNLDPLRYNLLFERFLNVERESMPDIDVDFCYNRREEVIRYVTDKYGKDSVSQITTFGTMKAKAAVRDVGRALGLSFAETDRIAKMVPDELKMTLKKALEMEPDLANLAKADPMIGKLIDTSMRLEGLARHASTHAAGVVISDHLPMIEHLPLYTGKKGEVVTQFDMKRVEKVGLIKFDFLGLKTLTVIDDGLKLARLAGKETPDLDTLPLDDVKTFELLCRAETEGVFQLESSGMRKVLRSLRPSCFEDIVALLALYRPGPLESGMVDTFIKCKHGEIPVEYPHPTLEPILKDTYGVILYQEQVMRIASDLANYSLGDGDILRRAMGKKDPAVMAEQRVKFMEGARENEIPEDVAAYIFDLMEKFAGYGFNKSHSAAYALVSYQTAYLKAHYPAEFMAALMTSEVSVTDKILVHINACRDAGIGILPPDINHSFHFFSVEEEKIRYGLSGIKGVGDGAIQTIVDERKQDGPFTSLLEFCERVNLRKVNKKVLENLIKSGAMDCLGCSRSVLLAGLEKVTALAQKRSKRKTGGQLSFMTMVEDQDACFLNGLGMEAEENRLEEFGDDEKFRMEKEALGFFLMGHPLLPFREELKRLKLRTLVECQEMGSGAEVQVGLLVTSKKEHITKKGTKMAFCQVEDLTAGGEVVVFPETYAQARALLDGDQPLLLKGKIGRDEDDGGEDGSKTAKLVAESFRALSDAAGEGLEPVGLRVMAGGGAGPDWSGLKELLARYRGQVPVRLTLRFEGCECDLLCGPRYQIAPSPEFWKEFEVWREKAGCA